MAAVERVVGVGLLYAFSWVAPAHAADSLCADLRYLPPDAALVVAFEPWPDAGDAALFRDALLAVTGFERELREVSDALTGARRVILSAVPVGDARVALLGVVRTDRQISPSSTRAAGVVVASARSGSFLFGDPAQVAHARQRRRTDQDHLASSGLLEPFLEAANEATVWGVVTRAGISCKGCASPRGDAHAEADIGSFTHSLAGMQWWTFAVSGTGATRLHMRTRTRSAEDAEVLADEQRAVLAALRGRARGGPDELSVALRQAQVRRAGVTIDLHLPESGPLLGWLCRKKDCDAPLQSLLKWQVGSEQREANERVSEVVRRLGVVPGEHVADVGAGLGFFTARLARAVGSEGRVLAVEIDRDLVTELRARAAEAPYPQVEVVLGTPEDPNLAAQSLDAVLIVNAYHEMPQHQSMLEAIRRALKPGGRLMLVEPFAPGKRANPRDAQEREHVLAPELAEQDLREVGFRVVECDEAFVQRPGSDRGEWLLLARLSEP